MNFLMSVVLEVSGPETTPGPFRGPSVGRSSFCCDGAGGAGWSDFCTASAHIVMPARKQTAKSPPPKFMVTSPGLNRDTSAHPSHKAPNDYKRVAYLLWTVGGLSDRKSTRLNSSHL